MSGVLFQLGRSGASGISVTVSRSVLGGFSNFGVPSTVNTGLPTTAIATGGVPPYTYAWTKVSGNADIFATNPALATTYFAAYFANHANKTGVWKCTVTDSAANVVDSDPVSISLTSRDGYNNEA